MKKYLLTLLTVLCTVDTWAYKGTINFYDADKLSSSSGTNLTGSNYAQFVTVPTGQTATNVITGVTCTGSVRYGMNGGLTVGTGSANGDAVTFTLGTNVVVTKCTVWATLYDGGKWKLNGSNADSGSASAKGTALGDVSNPYIWNNLSATTLAFTKCTADSKENQCKRLTILKIEFEYTVDGDPGASVSVTGVSLDKKTASLQVGKSVTLSATVSPNDATNKDITWSSSDSEIATVKNGVVKALKEGNATITVKTDDGNFSDQCEITVNAKTAPLGAIFYESFDAFAGNGGNDDVWSGILTATQIDANHYDNADWSKEGTVTEGYECASIRKDDNYPSGLTTPAIGVAGNGKVQFLAEAWGTDTSDFYVEILNGGTFTDGQTDIVSLTNNGTTAKVALKKKGQFTEYNLNFTGLTKNSKFRFYMAKGKRGFLDEVAVFITEKAYELTIGSCGWASMYLDFNAKVPENTKAYYASSVEEGIITLKSVDAGDVLPANTGVLVNGTTCTFTASNETPVEIDDNLFEGVTEATTCGASSVWVLNATATASLGDPVLSLYTGTTLGANKAYLPASKVAGAKALKLVFDGEATGIQSVHNNAQNGVVYNLAGQRVAAKAKGIVIMNGKKYINK